MHLFLAVLMLADTSGVTQGSAANGLSLTYEVTEIVARPVFAQDSRIVLNGSTTQAGHVQHLGSTAKGTPSATFRKHLRVEVGPGGAIVSSTDPALLTDRAVLDLFAENVRERIVAGVATWTSTDAAGRKIRYRVISQSGPSIQLEIQAGSARLNVTYDRTLGVPRRIETSTAAARTTYTLIQP